MKQIFQKDNTTITFNKVNYENSALFDVTTVINGSEVNKQLLTVEQTQSIQDTLIALGFKQVIKND